MGAISEDWREADRTGQTDRHPYLLETTRTGRLRHVTNSRYATGCCVGSDASEHPLSRGVAGEGLNAESEEGEEGRRARKER